MSGGRSEPAALRDYMLEAVLVIRCVEFELAKRKFDLGRPTSR